jgi:hypothetical protein
MNYEKDEFICCFVFISSQKKTELKEREDFVYDEISQRLDSIFESDLCDDDQVMLASLVLGIKSSKKEDGKSDEIDGEKLGEEKTDSVQEQLHL